MSESVRLRLGVVRIESSCKYDVDSEEIPNLSVESLEPDKPNIKRSSSSAAQLSVLALPDVIDPDLDKESLPQENTELNDQLLARLSNPVDAVNDALSDT